MEKRQFVTVSEWMAHGDIMEYIQDNHANRLELVRGFVSCHSSTKTRRKLHGAAQGLKYLHDSKVMHGDLKGVSISSFCDRFLFNLEQANILVSNDTPPRACLADFGFITTILDPGRELSCSAQSDGGTTTFISPELLMPERFGKKGPTPAPEADIYAFGLVIFQVCEQGRRYRPFICIYPPGPYGRDPVPWCSTIGVGVLCGY